MLAGALGLPGPAEVYDRWCDGEHHGVQSLVDAARILRCATTEGLAVAHTSAVPIWPWWLPQHTSHYAFGLPARMQAPPWCDYLRMGLDGGYYGVALVSMRGGGGEAGPDHWVLFCGARKAQAGRREVLVSCSATGERWVEAVDYLTRHGGFAMLMVRPTVNGGYHDIITHRAPAPT